MRSILISRLKCSQEGKQLAHLESVEFPLISETYLVPLNPRVTAGSSDYFSSVAKFPVTEHSTVS